MESAQAIDYTQNPRGESSVGGFGNVSLSTVRDSGTLVNKKRSISSTWRGPSSSSNIAHLFNPVKRLKPSIAESPQGRASQLSAFRDKYNRENDEVLFLSSAAKHWLVANKIMLREETFHLFPKLPQEVQDYIWDFALNAPKQLTISNVVRPHHFYAGPGLHGFHSHSRISPDFRNICLASRDAYSRFKQSRPPKFTYRNTAWMKNGYWNLEEDLVVLSDCYLYTMWDFVKDFRVELEKIRTLVIAPRQHLLWGSMSSQKSAKKNSPFLVDSLEVIY
jgi:hypothetical protein